MKLRGCVSLTALTLVMVIALTGCAKKKVPPPAPPPPAPPVVAAPPPPPPTPRPTPPPPPPAPAPAPLTEDQIFARKSVADLNAEMPLGDVQFEYDMATIRDDQRPTLQRNADYLRKWASIRVSVEGHADSRGTNEYNLALGERRANAVKEYLVGLGVAGDRMVVISKGEEAPLCSEDTEACWQRNRRGHFVITAK